MYVLIQDYAKRRWTSFSPEESPPPQTTHVKDRSNKLNILGKGLEKVALRELKTYFFKSYTKSLNKTEFGNKTPLFLY